MRGLKVKAGFILIDIEPYMSSVSLVEDNKLIEHYVEYKESGNLTGNIYKGRVVNFLHGLQSAFVDFGGSRNGFLSVEIASDNKTYVEQGAVSSPRIEAKEGDYLMVQATKEEIGQKGARLTTDITLPGRYVVFLPKLDFIGVSGKITDEKKRTSLEKLLDKYKPSGAGFIARTACVDATRSEIISEIKSLIELWKNILSAYDNEDGVGQLYNDGDLIFKSVRDMLGPGVTEVVCNNAAVAERIKKRLTAYNKKYAEKVKLYDGKMDIYDAFGILDDIDLLLERKIELDCGVNIVIDYAEALTVIDVNTARFDGKDNHEETVFAANLAAADEVARQIRLRNIGGMIIVDFIDMIEDEHKEAVVEKLREEFAFDRTKTRVIGMTPLGLVEITRKKTGRELSTVLLEKCPYCDGAAHTYTADYIARKIKAELKRLFAVTDSGSAFIYINSGLMDTMLSGRYFSEDCDTIWKDKRIYLVPSHTCFSRYFKVKGSEDAVLTVPPGAQLLY